MTQRIQDTLNSAKKHVSITTNEAGLILFYRTHRKALDALTERGVQVHIAAPISESNKHLVDELKQSFKVNNLPVSIPALILTADGNQLLLASYGLENDETQQKDTCLFVQNEAIAAIIKDILLGHFKGA